MYNFKCHQQQQLLQEVDYNHSKNTRNIVWRWYRELRVASSCKCGPTPQMRWDAMRVLGKGVSESTFSNGERRTDGVSMRQKLLFWSRTLALISASRNTHANAWHKLTHNTRSTHTHTHTHTHAHPHAHPHTRKRKRTHTRPLTFD